jgi:hypothetical protein
MAMSGVEERRVTRGAGAPELQPIFAAGSEFARG